MGLAHRVAAMAALSVIFLMPMPAHAEAHNELPVRDAWLRDYLPDDALLYARIPHPFGLLASPKGNALDAALRSDANLVTIAKLRDGISANVLPRIPMFHDVRLRLLEKHLQSPVELAVLPLPAPSLLVSASVDVASNKHFERLFEEIESEDTSLRLTAPLDEHGTGQLEGLGVPAMVRFDATNGRLLLNAGPSVSAESFSLAIENVARNVDHDMRSLEFRVDQSGQGLFLWINAERALPMVMMTMQPEQYEQLTNLGLDKASSAAFGWGVASGKGRISVVANLREEYDRGFVPLVDNDIAATAVGDPDGLMLISIPTPEEFARIEARILDAVEADSIADWDDVKDELVEKFGFSFEDMLGAAGPEMLLIFDEAGDYGALRLRDRKLWDRIIESIADEIDSEPETRRIDGRTFYHWAIQGEMADLDMSPETESQWFAELFARQKEHTYWTYDGDYMYFASVPQILLDRYEMGATTSIRDWLEGQQFIDVSEAMISLSGTSDKLPERIYAVYLEVLQFLADISQTDIDMWSMPTARQLGLPRGGTLGFTISLGDPTLAAEFTFENNPAEFLGGVAGIAMVGIVAAIAIPAYQDYQTRARVSEALTLAAPAKAAVTEHYVTNGAFPGPIDAAAMSMPDDAGEHIRSIIIEPGSGRILIDLTDESVPGGGQLYLRPVPKDDGSLDWKCSATLADKHLPERCRGGEDSGYSGA
ncbi:MAG: pilin [Woeseiaceae bacterium]|nr:pilin [Woeseiaceae bacterium]